VIGALLPEAKERLADEITGEMLNWRGIVVGRVEASETLQSATAAL
jgi:hypothetical protein